MSYDSLAFGNTHITNHSHVLNMKMILIMKSNIDQSQGKFSVGCSVSFSIFIRHGVVSVDVKDNHRANQTNASLSRQHVAWF